MKLTTKTFRRAAGGAVLAAILATAASAESPSWPTPPAPAPQAETPAPQAESPAPQTKPASQLSAGRLGQMLAPVALYPDDLLADILMAATYPLDVAEAARWLEDPQNAALKGDQLFAALQEKSWDPSVKSLAPLPQVLRMLDANLEWTEQLGEAYLADPAAVMDAVQRLRRQAQSAGRLVTTPQEIVRPEQEPSRIEEPITIEAPGPEVVYVPICDPSFAYGPWPYPDYAPFFPLFAGATINGCSWISGPILAPFLGFAVLNFRTRHIEIDRRRLALFDRDKDGEKDREHALGEEWRHDPGHRGNVPYRNPAVNAVFGRPAPGAIVNPGSLGRWMGPPPIVAPRAVALPQARLPSAVEGSRPPLDAARRSREEMRSFPEGGRSPIAGVQPRSLGAQPALEGVDPTSARAPIGQPLDPETERRILIERGVFGRAPPTALAAPPGDSRASQSLGGIGPARSLGDRRFLRPLVGVGARPFGARGTGAIGVQPFNGQGPQAPFGGMGASGGRVGR
ncbi:MAG TPA: DUF3300 domain-containing protein [Roseiarcus sp.]|nr:DUF3300 domain-containing protein [Roseiarcus sp.]